MFTSPGPNLYESSDGFSVELLGRTGLRYGEASRQMFVDSEVLTGPSGMAVYKDTIRKWDSPNDSVPVTDSDRDRQTLPFTANRVFSMSDPKKNRTA